MLRLLLTGKNLVVTQLNAHIRSTFGALPSALFGLERRAGPDGGSRNAEQGDAGHEKYELANCKAMNASLDELG